MKRRFQRKDFFIIFMIVSGFFMFVAMGNGYWRENAPYKISSVDIKASLDENGFLNVAETSLYELSRNNRTASKRLHLSYPAVLESFNVQVDQMTGVVREVSSSPGGFDVRIFVNEDVGSFTAGTNYRLSGVVENGSDVSVLSYRFWEPNSDAMTRNISLSLELPEQIARAITTESIFLKPYKEAKVTIEGNRVLLSMKSVLSSASAEIMVVFPRSIGNNMSRAINTTISRSSIEKENETSMFQQAFLSGLIGFQIAVPIFVLFFTFVLFGIEPQIKTEIGHRIDSAPGYLLNAIVKNPFQEVDRDGFLATILELHNSGEVKLQDRTILASAKNNTMPTQQQWAIQAIKSLGSDGKDEVEIPDQEYKGEGIEAFNRHYGFWQKHAMKVVRSGRFYEHLGSTVMSVFSIFFLITWSLILKYLFANWQVYLTFPDETLVLSIVLYADWCLGWFLLMIPKSIFGRWTPSGRLFYMEWKTAEKEILAKQEFSDEDLEKLVALGYLQTLLADRKRLSERQLELLRTLQRLELLLTRPKE